MFDIFTDLAPLAKADDGATPPQAVRAACRRGLELAGEFGGDGLTDGAKARAQAMASGRPVSRDNLARMSAFFSRHQSNRADPSAKEPTPGAVAWLIWGGDAGREWANGQVEGGEAEKAGKRNLVGGNRGAWAHAKKQAEGKANPEAYAAKVYANITGKSLAYGQEGNMGAAARKILVDYLQKAPGDRGGKILGTTASGKPIYQRNHNRYGHIKSGGVPENDDSDRDAYWHAKKVAQSHSNFSAADHHDAARAHVDAHYKERKAGNKMAAAKHYRIAVAHDEAASVVGD